MSEKEEIIYRLFDEIGIKYKAISHKAVYTIDEASEIDKKLGVKLCKNLFLTTRHKTELYLLFMVGDKRFNTGLVSKQIGVPRMTFGLDELLEEVLDVASGSVTPLALINDKENKVGLLLDKDVLNMEYISMHPLINTATVVIRTSDFIDKFLPYINHSYMAVEV